MRRVISFLLVLVLCLSLVCPALAAVASPGEDGPVKEPTDNPQTGDMIMGWVIIFVLSLALLMTLTVVYRKKYR